MTKRTTDSLDRERALYRYSDALLRGDFDTVTAVLTIAETDTVLAQMLLELDQAYEEENARTAVFEQDKATVGSLLQQHLTASEPAEVEDILPVTVGEVVSRLHADRSVPAADLLASQILKNSPITVPLSPTTRAMKELAASLGVALSERFWRAFRDAALLLGLRTSQEVSYAAARKQHTQRSAPAKSPPRGGRSDD